MTCVSPSVNSGSLRRTQKIDFLKVSRISKQQMSDSEKAWISYYLMIENHIKMLEKQKTLIREIIVQNNPSFGFSEINRAKIPGHLMDELMPVFQKFNYPVCMETMTKDTFSLTKCFHKIYEDCIQKIKNTSQKCPICRKKL